MPGLIRGVARTAVVAGTATAVSNRVSRRQAGRWAQQAPQAAEQPATAPVGSGLSAADERIARLSKLADLKAQGVLTDAEFETEKQAILRS